MTRFVTFADSNTNMNVGGSSYFSRLKNSATGISTNTIMIIGFILVCILVIIFYYYYYISPTIKPTYKPNSEIMPSGSENQAELMFFYADWCPHCKTAKPIWEDLKAEYENKLINGYHVIFTEINCANESAETEKLMDKYKVEGFPTIKLLKDGQVIGYDAKPSKETLEQFLNTVL